MKVLTLPQMAKRLRTAQTVTPEDMLKRLVGHQVIIDGGLLEEMIFSLGYAHGQMVGLESMIDTRPWEKTSKNSL